MHKTDARRLAVEVARRAILQQWQQRDVSSEADIASEMLIFYGWLREARPNLLAFDCHGEEPWRLVQEWLEVYERTHPRV